MPTTAQRRTATADVTEEQLVNRASVDRDGTRHISEVFRALAQARHVSLTTYGDDGTPVATPVRMAMDGARMYVQTAPDSAHLARIRRTATVEVAPCRARGRVTGAPIPAVAWVVEGGEADLGARLLYRKYRWHRRLGRLLAARRDKATVILKIVPA